MGPLTPRPRAATSGDRHGARRVLPRARRISFCMKASTTPRSEQHTADEIERRILQACQYSVEVCLGDGTTRDKRWPGEPKRRAPESPSGVIAALSHKR